MPADGESEVVSDSDGDAFSIVTGRSALVRTNSTLLTRSRPSRVHRWISRWRNGNVSHGPAAGLTDIHSEAAEVELLVSLPFTGGSRVDVPPPPRHSGQERAAATAAGFHTSAGTRCSYWRKERTQTSRGDSTAAKLATAVHSLGDPFQSVLDLGEFPALVRTSCEQISSFAESTAESTLSPTPLTSESLRNLSRSSLIALRVHIPPRDQSRL